MTRRERHRRRRNWWGVVLVAALVLWWEVPSYSWNGGKEPLGEWIWFVHGRTFVWCSVVVVVTPSPWSAVPKATPMGPGEVNVAGVRWDPLQQRLEVRTLWVTAVPGLGMVLEWLLMLRRDALPGHCPHCGYDCRATPGRCSECGWVGGGSSLQDDVDQRASKGANESQ